MPLSRYQSQFYGSALAPLDAPAPSGRHCSAPAFSSGRAGILASIDASGQAGIHAAAVAFLDQVVSTLERAG